MSSFWILQHFIVGGGSDNWSYKACEAPVKLSSSTNEHPTFHMPDALPVIQPTVPEDWREKYHIPWAYSSQAHLWSSNPVFDHQIWSYMIMIKLWYDISSYDIYDMIISINQSINHKNFNVPISINKNSESGALRTYHALRNLPIAYVTFILAVCCRSDATGLYILRHYLTE